MKIALVGATGLVGGVMRKVLEERGFGDCELIPAASSRSVGKKVTFAGKMCNVVSVEEAIEQAPEYAIFSAGSGPSLQYAPLFAAKGTVVIDNSSAWRSDPSKPLVVPEINGDVVTPADHIIANPNCSTIQMVMALAPLHRRYRIRRDRKWTAPTKYGLHLPIGHRHGNESGQPTGKRAGRRTLRARLSPSHRYEPDPARRHVRGEWLHH